MWTLDNRGKPEKTQSNWSYLSEEKRKAIKKAEKMGKKNARASARDKNTSSRRGR